MKKNLFFGLFATMVLLLTTACQKENDLLGNGEATISFEISTPQMATRAFSDGTLATQLQYAVYDENNDRIERIDPVTTAIENGRKRVDIQLAAGRTYHILFWAANEDAPYTIDFDNLQMNVDYTGAVSNDELRDAFYCYYTVTADYTKTKQVLLTRPFAQLNIGANDFERLDGVNVAKTGVKVDVFSTLNFVDGSVDGLVDNQEFALNTIPAAEEVFPVNGYKYLAMNYLLVGADKKAVDVEFNYVLSSDENNPQVRTYSGIPVMANHRTNIYGELLTGSVGFDVIIDNGYDNPEVEVPLLTSEYGDFGEVITIGEGANAEKAIIFSITEDEVKAVSIKEITMSGKTWDDAMAWAESLGEGWSLASMEDLDGIHPMRVYLNEQLSADDANNALFEEDEYLDKSKNYYAFYISSDEAIGVDPQGIKYSANHVFVKAFNLDGYSHYPYSATGLNTIHKRAPMKDNYLARAVYNFNVAKVKDVADFNAALENPNIKEVTINSDLEYESTVAISIEKDLVIEGEGKTITAGGAASLTPSIATMGDYNVEINDANVVGGFVGAYYGANVSLNGGSLKFTDGMSGRNCFYAVGTNELTSIITIKDVDVNMANASGNSYLCAQGNAIIYVEGGKFYGKPVGSSNPYVKEVAYGDYTGQVIITGGTFNFDPSEWVAEGYKAVQSGSEWSVVAE